MTPETESTTSPPPDATPAPGEPSAPQAPQVAAGQTVRSHDAAARPRRRRRSWPSRLVSAAIWLVVVCLTVTAALMISAWLTGFRLENGLPDVMAMLGWIRANYLGE